MNPAGGGGRIGGLIIGTRTGSIPGGGGGTLIPSQHSMTTVCTLCLKKTTRRFSCDNMNVFSVSAGKTTLRI